MKRTLTAIAVAVTALILLLVFTASRELDPDVLGNCITRNAETCDE